MHYKYFLALQLLICLLQVWQTLGGRSFEFSASEADHDVCFKLYMRYKEEQRIRKKAKSKFHAQFSQL